MRNPTARTGANRCCPETHGKTHWVVGVASDAGDLWAKLGM